MIAREAVNNKFGRTAMYRIVVDSDPEVQETLDLLKKHPALKDMFRYAEDQKSIKKASIGK
jgi:hypothetical protein